MTARRAPYVSPLIETEEQRLARLDQAATRAGRARRVSSSMAKRYYRDVNEVASKPAAPANEK